MLRVTIALLLYILILLTGGLVADMVSPAILQCLVMMAFVILAIVVVVKILAKVPIFKKLK